MSGHFYEDLQALRKVLENEGYIFPGKYYHVWDHKEDPRKYVIILEYSNGHKIQRGRINARVRRKAY
jgi:hypothetical protein